MAVSDRVLVGAEVLSGVVPFGREVQAEEGKEMKRLSRPRNEVS